MKYLLDTHTLLWYFENPSRLSSKAERIIDDDENQIFISLISFWEIALKANSGKLNLKLKLDSFFDNIETGDFTITKIESKYIRRLSELPFIHKDPFDRMLISTAVTEGLTIITADKDVKKYDVKCVW